MVDGVMSLMEKVFKSLATIRSFCFDYPIRFFINMTGIVEKING